MNGDINASGYSRQWLDIAKRLGAGLNPGSENAISNPSFSGAWIDRPTLASLAMSYEIADPRGYRRSSATPVASRHCSRNAAEKPPRLILLFRFRSVS
jgi:hypothetical protein